jgi:hypothetical protein
VVHARTAEQLVAGAHRECPYSKATRGNINVVEIALRVSVKTLVVHARDDRVVPVEEGAPAVGQRARAAGLLRFAAGW